MKAHGNYRWSPEQKATRNPYAYLPFGVGPRNCVGMRLAQMEAKMAAVAMLQKFRFIRAPETEVCFFQILQENDQEAECLSKC